jgi:hypothetical protein
MDGRVFPVGEEREDLDGSPGGGSRYPVGAMDGHFAASHRKSTVGPVQRSLVRDESNGITFANDQILIVP